MGFKTQLRVESDLLRDLTVTHNNLSYIIDFNIRYGRKYLPIRIETSNGR